MEPLKILLAQHGPQAPAGLAEALRARGFQVELSRNQADTWIALQQGGHDVVLLVPVERDGQGPELASLLRPRAGGAEPAVLVLTDDPRLLAEHVEWIDDFLSPQEPPDALACRVRFGLARRRARERLLRDSSTDFKTGLPNDRRFAEQCRIECARAGRENHPLSVLLIDLDEFKSINDEHDHDFGDHALRRLADTLRESLRPFDTPARKGGDEFAVLLPHTSLAQAANIAERLRSSVAQMQLEHGGHRRRLTISLGVATWHPEGEETFEQVLLGADKALLGAKELGRNRVELHVPPRAPPPVGTPPTGADLRRPMPAAAEPGSRAPALPPAPQARTSPQQPEQPEQQQPQPPPAKPDPPTRRRGRAGGRPARRTPVDDGG